jgi:trimeric autotransporter adhesin
MKTGGETKKEGRSMNPSIRLRKAIPLCLVALVCFAVSPVGRAVSPPPDGGYPGANTAEGDDALFSLTTGDENTALGYQALFSTTDGRNNTAIGNLALFHNTGEDNTAIGRDALFHNTEGSDNTATGDAALFNTTTGSFNTADGSGALFVNTTGDYNTATGISALSGNQTGSANTANGAFALSAINTGDNNTAIGVVALFSNTTGNGNTANGVRALFSNTTGSLNTATGFLALAGVNMTGSKNTANGSEALFRNRSGSKNTANGFESLSKNTTGSQNTATGYAALEHNMTGSNNTANGSEALENNTTGSNNIALGVLAGANLTIGDNNIDIGNRGVGGDSQTIRIGTEGTQQDTYIAGIREVTTQNADAIPVLIDSAGQLGTISSSRRFKKEVKPMDKASEAILALKPVTFRYKDDKTNRPQFGLIAEEVAEVNPDLIMHDKNGEIYTVRYDQVNAMLLNEFLKEHRKLQELEATIAKQQKDFQTTATHHQKQIEALTAGLQKVSDQLELKNPSPRTVLNNQ